MSVVLEDVGVSVDGQVFIAGMNATLASSGLYEVTPRPSADALGTVLAREAREGLRVWGRIRVDGLDWRIRPPAVRVRHRQRTGGASIFETLMGALPVEEAVDAFAGGLRRSQVLAEIARWGERIGFDISLDARVDDLDERSASLLEWLRAAVAAAPLVWADDGSIGEGAIAALAAERTVVVAGPCEGATPIELPAAGAPPPLPPRWFRWIVDGQLGGMRRPGAMGELKMDIQSLVELGVSHVVGLEESPIAADEMRAAGIRYRHFPVVDMEAPVLAPTRELTHETLEVMGRGGSVAFHCKAGLGRTGTLLAACLIEQGYGLHQALSLLRQMRAEYVQSKEQVEFLHCYVESLER